MKIIVRKSDNVVIYGTDDNNTTIEVVDNNLVINGDVIATNVNESDYDLVTAEDEQLPTPFYVGYTTYIYSSGFSWSADYSSWNLKTHDCLKTLESQYSAKSEDPSYSPEERSAFLDYVVQCIAAWNVIYIPPTFEYPCPPDETFPFYPSCSL